MNTIIHVLNEKRSPVGNIVYTMWCGEQCFVWDDASLTPEDFDFYMENAAYKSNCCECQKKYLSRERQFANITEE